MGSSKKTNTEKEKTAKPKVKLTRQQRSKLLWLEKIDDLRKLCRQMKFIDDDDMLVINKGEQDLLQDKELSTSTKSKIDFALKTARKKIHTVAVCTEEDVQKCKTMIAELIRLQDQRSLLDDFWFFYVLNFKEFLENKNYLTKKQKQTLFDIYEKATQSEEKKHENLEKPAVKKLLEKIDPLIQIREQYPAQLQGDRAYHFLTSLRSFAISHGRLSDNQIRALESMAKQIEEKEVQKQEYLISIAKIKQHQMSFNTIPNELFMLILKHEDDLNNYGRVLVQTNTIRALFKNIFEILKI